MSELWLLDLYCGAGGCTAGYQRAGFKVLGVDRAPQPRYCGDAFVQADALEYLDSLTWLELVRLVGIHASPPCQAFTKAQNARGQAHRHFDLIDRTRRSLEDTGLPYVLENVPGAPLRRDVMLCGTQFGLEAGGFELRRHRIFEMNWPLGTLVAPCMHRLPSAPIFGHGAGRDFYERYGPCPIETRRAVMGIGWMNRDELGEAVPPAFTQFIGGRLQAHLEARLVVAP